MLDYTQKTSKKRTEILDILHIILGAAILIQAVVGFVRPQENIRMFPFVFLTGTVIITEELIYKLRHLPRGKKPWGGVVFDVFLMLFLAAITILAFKAFIL